MEKSEGWFVWAGVGLETLAVPLRQFVSVTFERSDGETLSSHAWADNPSCVVAWYIGSLGWGRWRF